MGGGSIGEIRPSATISLDGNVYIVLDCTHVKQAKRGRQNHYHRNHGGLA